MMEKKRATYWYKVAVTLTAVFLSAAFAAPLQAEENTEIISINTDETTLIYSARKNDRLVFQYYGKFLADVSAFKNKEFPAISQTNRDYSYEGYPAFGYGNTNEPALSVIHADGSISTELEFLNYDQNEISDNETQTVIHLKDKVYDLFVDFYTTAYLSEDVIVQWVEIRNEENGSVVLKNLYSSFLNLKAQNYYLTHFHGAWANEMTVVEEKLEPGIKTIETKKGVRTTQTENSAFIISLNGPSRENSGECYGGALAWSGNYKLSFQIDERQTLSFLGGMNPFMSEYILDPEDELKTPKMVLSYSSEGRGRLSRNLHDWVRKYSLHNGDVARPVVLNSWEGAYFNFDESLITNMMDEAAKMGIEMFVLDDGWFGNKYPRNNPRAGLGDWQTNTKKLPRGISYLAKYANERGMQFGLWVEPEMVNPQSVLAKTHPDWVVQSPGREKLTLRNQWLLDLSNPEVQKFIWNTIDSILTANPRIDYLKWDANKHAENVGSTYLPNDRQTHFWIEYTKGLYSVYEKIRNKYPELIMQVCSSGGGRLDFGSLKYHDEFWASDDTDPMRRLFIQYGTNLIYPPVATAAHVSTSPNHQTGRETPLKFRFDVAMTGRLGMELQPKDLQGKDSLFAVNAINEYKDFRHLIVSGDLYRLNSPYDDDGFVSLMYISKDTTSAVFFAFSTKLHFRGEYPTIKLNGLDKNKKYRVEEINRQGKSAFWGNGKTFTGEYLMQAGVDLLLSKQYESAVFRISEVN